MTAAVSNEFIRNIPNILTFSRMLLLMPFIIYFSEQEYVLSFYFFLMAGITDGLDGWLARHYHWQSAAGSFLDPLADKLLVASSFLLLAFIHKLPVWLVILVFMRDITIIGGIALWYMFIQEKLTFLPTFISKINTTLQLALVTLCLFELAFFMFPNWVKVTLIAMTAITTTLSYIHYISVWGIKAYFIHHAQNKQYPH